MVSNAPGSSTIHAVARTLRAIEMLAGDPDGITVTELAQELNSDGSVASRILSTLVAEGWVDRVDATERHHLTLRLVSTAFSFADRLGFPSICMPVLQRLSRDSGELSQLAVVEHDRLIYVANAAGTERLMIAPTIGQGAAPHATASGKAWLATLPEDEALRIALAGGLTQFTPTTITRPQALLDELSTVRERGYALTRGEFNRDISAIAVAIGVERFGRSVGTLVISCPSSRFEARIDEFAALVAASRLDIEAAWPN